MSAMTRLAVLDRSDDADLARASRREHAVEDMNSLVDVDYPTFVHTWAQPIADPLFPAPQEAMRHSPLAT